MLPPAPVPRSRLGALTDGIFAVTMTLLVLELRFPEPAAGMLTDLVALAGRLDNYAISFAVLAVFWLGHVRILQRLREADTTFAAINLAFLLFTTFVPPLTTLLGDHPGLPSAAVLYGANLVAILGCEMALWHRLCGRLANDSLDDPAATWRLVRRRYAMAIGVVVAGVAVALAEIGLGTTVGLAPWFYLLLIGLGIVRPPLKPPAG